MASFSRVSICFALTVSSASAGACPKFHHPEPLSKAALSYDVALSAVPISFLQTRADLDVKAAHGLGVDTSPKTSHHHYHKHHKYHHKHTNQLDASNNTVLAHFHEEAVNVTTVKLEGKGAAALELNFSHALDASANLSSATGGKHVGTLGAMEEIFSIARRRGSVITKAAFDDMDNVSAELLLVNARADTVIRYVAKDTDAAASRLFAMKLIPAAQRARHHIDITASNMYKDIVEMEDLFVKQRNILVDDFLAAILSLDEPPKSSMLQTSSWWSVSNLTWDIKGQLPSFKKVRDAMSFAWGRFDNNQVALAASHVPKMRELMTTLTDQICSLLHGRVLDEITRAMVQLEHSCTDADVVSLRHVRNPGFLIHRSQRVCNKIRKMQDNLKEYARLDTNRNGRMAPLLVNALAAMDSFEAVAHELRRRTGAAEKRA